MEMALPLNVLGTPLKACSQRPRTGFFRDGCCNTNSQDLGSHTVCVIVTDAFLQFSRAVGNDLSSPVPAHGFPGLKHGDQWCLCAPRWQQALQADAAPMVVLESTHQLALKHVELDDLLAHAAAPEGLEH